MWDSILSTEKIDYCGGTVAGTVTVGAVLIEHEIQDQNVTYMGRSKLQQVKVSHFDTLSIFQGGNIRFQGGRTIHPR